MNCRVLAASRQADSVNSNGGSVEEVGKSFPEPWEPVGKRVSSWRSQRLDAGGQCSRIHVRMRRSGSLCWEAADLDLRSGLWQ